MTEDKLSGLFDEIRNESAQTSVSEVNQWIETAVAGAATIGLLATLKLFLIKKPLIMWSTFITLAGGASLSAVVLFSQPEVKEKQENKQFTRDYTAPAKKNETKEIEEVKMESDPETPISESPIEKTNTPQGTDFPEDLGIHIPVIIPDPDHKPTKLAPLKTLIGGTFTKLDVSGVINVELTQGKSCGVEIYPERAKDVIIVEIEDGTLHLTNDPDKWNKHMKENAKEEIVVKVTIEKLERIDLSGATTLKTMNQLNAATLVVDLTGASNMDLDVKATKVRGDFSGASNITLIGTSESVDLDVSGAAQANLFRFSAKKAKVDNSGAGQLELSVSEALVIDGSGASVTYYKVDGESKSISISAETSGSAVVKKKN